MFKLKSQNRQQKASSIVETLAGSFIIIPVILFFLDVVGCVLSQMANDHMCKDIARQCAELAPPAGQPYNSTTMSNAASTLAGQVYTDYVTGNSMLLKDATAPGGWSGNPNVIYDGVNGSGTASGIVSVKTCIKCNLLVPLPLVGISSINFVSSASEPIVANLPLQ